MNNNEVWTATLDEKYTITVVRTNPYRATLTLSEGERILHQASVGLMYDAMFGPDVEDVESWQELATRFIDGGS